MRPPLASPLARGHRFLWIALAGLALALSALHLGWSALRPGAPDTAEGSAVAPAATEIASPFAPFGAAEPGGLSALLADVRLDGVRIADDSARSGAVFTLGDGAQHARAIGQTIAPGVVLAEVGEDFVVLTFEGVRHRLALGAAFTDVSSDSLAAETAREAPRSP